MWQLKSRSIAKFVEISENRANDGQKEGVGDSLGQDNLHPSDYQLEFKLQKMRIMALTLGTGKDFEPLQAVFETSGNV